jgi:hypothetical protein
VSHLATAREAGFCHTATTERSGRIRITRVCAVCGASDALYNRHRWGTGCNCIMGWAWVFSDPRFRL